MARGWVETFIDKQAWIDTLADKVQPLISNLYNSGGEAGRTVKDAMNGVWLGHSVHSAITDVPVGAWATAEFLDLLSAKRGGDKGLDSAAEAAIGLGLLGAVGAAVTGFTDWSEIGGSQRRMGLAHALVNTAGLTLNLASFLVRRGGGSLGTARALSATGFLINTTAAYLGGELVYRLGQAVSRDAWVDGPEQYTDIAASADLADGQMHKYDVANTAVVLVRDADGIHAFNGICPHFGGPLWEGKLEDHCLTCPWHGSQFDIEDGHLLHGPSTHPVPCYDIREEGGRIRVRLEQTG